MNYQQEGDDVFDYCAHKTVCEDGWCSSCGMEVSTALGKVVEFLPPKSVIAMIELVGTLITTLASKKIITEEMRDRTIDILRTSRSFPRLGCQDLCFIFVYMSWCSNGGDLNPRTLAGALDLNKKRIQICMRLITSGKGLPFKISTTWSERAYYIAESFKEKYSRPPTQAEITMLRKLDEEEMEIDPRNANKNPHETANKIVSRWDKRNSRDGK